MKNNFVVVLRTTMTLEQAEMARIQGVNVRAMAGEDMSTRTTRRLWCAWLYSQSRGAGAARGGVGGRGRFFPRQRNFGRERRCRNGGAGRRQ